MGKLVINHNLVTPEKAEALVSLCPFGAISYENGKLDISSGCKMCKMCVRKGQGLVDFLEEKQEIDKSLWKGICVYADCDRGRIHRVTFELLGKAKELGETAKLNLDNVSEEENKKRIYAEIGKRYVLENPVAEEGYADLYAQLEEIEARIAANKARLEELK